MTKDLKARAAKRYWGIVREAKEAAEEAHDFYAHTGFGEAEAITALGFAKELEESASLFEASIPYGSGSPPF